MFVPWLFLLLSADIDKVIENTTEICKVTHADPRCIASCIAVTTAVSVELSVYLSVVTVILWLYTHAYTHARTHTHTHTHTQIALMLQGKHDLTNKKQLSALVETALSVSCRGSRISDIVKSFLAVVCWKSSHTERPNS